MEKLKSFSLVFREKGRNLTYLHDNNPYTNRENLKKESDNTKTPSIVEVL